MKMEELKVDGERDDGGMKEEKSTVPVMPLSRSFRHKITAGAGWHGNAAKESHFLGGETAVLPLERE